MTLFDPSILRWVFYLGEFILIDSSIIYPFIITFLQFYCL